MALPKAVSLAFLFTALWLCFAGVAVRAADKADRSAGPGEGAIIEKQIDADLADAKADLLSILTRLRGSFHGALAAVETFPADMMAALDREEPREEIDAWVFGGLGAGVVAVIAGLIVAIPFERFTIGHPKALPPGETELSVNERIAFLLRRGGLWLVGTLILFLVGLGVLEVLGKDHDLLHRTALLILVWFAGVRAARQIFRTIVAPGLHGCRIVALEDREARGLMRSLSLFAALFGLVVVADIWLVVLQLPTESRQLVGLALSALLVLILIALCVTDRRVVTRALGWTAGWRGWVARNWWLVAVVYFIVSWVIRGIRVLIGDGGGSELVVAPVLLVFAGLALQGVCRLVLAQLIRPSATLYTADGRRLPDFLDLSYTGAALVISLTAFGVLLETWGLSFSGTGAGLTAIKAGLIAVCGYLVYKAIEIAVERKLAMEGAIPGIVVADPDGAQPLAPGQSRIATLLPMARAFLLTAVIVISAMMILSELGVQVAPLFAGAGIIGLALGFGSQTLVHDVMSGAFFLIDDAFRVGEYVDVGGAQGTVERISIRSFQLRRTNGDLATIPFGGVKQINNLSRDWQVAKLPFRFPLGTDPEKVRKVIKKVGERLAADPDLGPKFIAPAKSQGISAVDSGGLTMRVKFITRPADLFMVKRQVYLELLRAFEAAGLALTNNVVTVHIDNPEALTAAEKAAAAGAAAAQAGQPAAG
ncbi:mechanosensitive ion channel domain-containing protein [Pseudoxanthobacter sp.]|uniref:mechanosensitive ion channel family protein n=1 Tax=Pseudoxanthobacter sp. TaxID=1925742 RepID=UPI002FDFAB95